MVMFAIIIADVRAVIIGDLHVMVHSHELELRMQGFLLLKCAFMFAFRVDLASASV